MECHKFLELTIIFLFINALVSAQDRNPGTHIIYPKDAFIQNGGRIIDVTKPPFNARRDGVHDDTEELIAAYTAVADSIRKYGWHNNQASFILYFPEGTYLISNTLIYSGERIQRKGWNGIIRVRMVGESQDKTIIKLKDNSSGFGRGSQKPVVAFQKGYKEGGGNNIPASNQFRNLTVDSGSGNPGAIGLVFMGANVCGINNVTVKSDDGSGFAGLDIPTFSTQGYLKDITINGFDYGIRVVPHGETDPSFEYVTLKNQIKAGMQVEEGGSSVRKLYSNNSVPALKITEPAAQVVITDSKLTGGSSENPAISIKETDTGLKGELIANDITVEGYNTSVKKGGKDVLSGDIDNYVSDSIYAFSKDQLRKPLNLKPAESPIIPWEQNMNEWANVEKFRGATTAKKIQHAMNSGKSTIFFPKASYTINHPVDVPASVKHIDFMYSATNSHATFRVAASSKVPLVIENGSGRMEVQQLAPRTVVIRNTSSRYVNKQSKPTTLFLESAVNLGTSENFCTKNQKVWARSIDNENKNRPNFIIDGGTMWVLGYKTEGPQPGFYAKNDAILEVLGGYRNETMEDEGYPMVINAHSNVSFSAFSSMARVYESAVWEINSKDTLKYRREDMPQRHGAFRKDYFIPLYVGYDLNRIP